jgi:hypothetical protein
MTSISGFFISICHTFCWSHFPFPTMCDPVRMLESHILTGSLFKHFIYASLFILCSLHCHCITFYVRNISHFLFVFFSVCHIFFVPFSVCHIFILFHLFCLLNVMFVSHYVSHIVSLCPVFCLSHC